jgi:hypothetical protein
MRQNLMKSWSCCKYGWFLGAFAKLRRATICFVISLRLSVRMEQLCFHWTNFCYIWYWGIFRISVKKIQVSFKSDNNKGTLHEDQYIFQITFSTVLLRLRSVSDKCCTENTYFVFNDFFTNICSFMRKCGKIIWSDAGHRWQYGACVLHAGYVRLQTHTGCVILIVFPLQQCLHERPSKLR